MRGTSPIPLVFLLTLVGCTEDSEVEDDECEDTEAADTDDCSVVSGPASGGTSGATVGTGMSTGGTETTNSSGTGPTSTTDEDTTGSGSSESGETTGGDSSWWMEVSGPLSIPRSEGDVVANTLTPGAGGLGGSSVNGSANFQSVVNLAGSGPGTYAASSFLLETADGEFSCVGSVEVELTVNTLEPLDADFSGTVNCNPGPEFDPENDQEHTLTGHVEE